MQLCNVLQNECIWTFFVFNCISNVLSSSSQALSKICRAETDGAINKMSSFFYTYTCNGMRSVMLQINKSDDDDDDDVSI